MKRVAGDSKERRLKTNESFNSLRRHSGTGAGARSRLDIVCTYFDCSDGRVYHSAYERDDFSFIRNTFFKEWEYIEGS